MQAALDFLFDSGGFSPHGYCLSWQPAVLYTHLLSDLLIGLSYLSVAATLLVFTRRRVDLQFPRLFLSFTIVFALCGVSHLSEGVTLWFPVYGAQGAFKAVTGLLSLATAVLLWFLLPRALALPSPATLRTVNDDLQREIEERRRAERIATTARVRAEQANAAKANFLAAMSHELRTPLNAILGFSEALMRDIFGPLSARHKVYVTLIHTSGSHLLQLINDLLDISRIDAGRLELEREPVDVGEVVRSGVELMHDRATARDLALEAAVAPGLPPLVADKLRLRQILLNLLSNAIKFTPAGGRVRVAVGPAEGGGLAITVSDTGIGMAPGDIPRALEMFSQVDNTLTRKYDGAGIGLPLSKALAELHGGSLSIDSQPGRGTTVTVLLPSGALPAPA